MGSICMYGTRAEDEIVEFSFYIFDISFAKTLPYYSRLTACFLTRLNRSFMVTSVSSLVSSLGNHSKRNPLRSGTQMYICLSDAQDVT